MPIYLLSGGFDTDGGSVPKILFSAVRMEGAFVEGSGALRKSGKTKIAKIWPNFKMTVISNYSPKFRLLFTI